VPIYLHRDPVDFRKAINGLSSIVETSMELSAFDSDKFIWPKKHYDSVVNWNLEQLNWLLRGIDVSKISTHNSLKYNSI